MLSVQADETWATFDQEKAAARAVAQIHFVERNPYVMHRSQCYVQD